MGNNFNRGIENRVSGRTRDNIGDIWVATYAPSDPADHSTDGSKYIRTVILATNTFGLGSFNDKTDLTVDPSIGNMLPGQIFTVEGTTRSSSAAQPIMARASVLRSRSPAESAGTRAPRLRSARRDRFTSGGRPTSHPAARPARRLSLLRTLGRRSARPGLSRRILRLHLNNSRGTGRDRMARTCAQPALLSRWYDSRGDANDSADRPPCNSATGHTSAWLNARYAESTDGGKPGDQASELPVRRRTSTMSNSVGAECRSSVTTSPLRLRGTLSVPRGPISGTRSSWE